MNKQEEIINPHCGYIAVVGRPNVGKSTLMNHLLGQKISITSRKPQTTRQKILGIKTQGEYQMIYIDTPGLHQKQTYALNRLMNRAATEALQEADVILWVVQATDWLESDEWILTKLTAATQPVILVVNKIDTVGDKKILLPYLEKLSKKYSFSAMIPVSALRHDNLNAIELAILPLLPTKKHLYAPDDITNRSMKFLASEMIREKLFRALGEELPYALAVTVDIYHEDKKLVRIAATIYVDKIGQKAIVIGKGGHVLKQVGQQARLDLEKMTEKKVFLQLWVKVKDHWADNSTILKNFGYE